MVVAAYLGNSAVADIYHVAYSAPNFVVELLALGAMGAATIPVFQDILHQRGEVALQSLYNRVATAVLCGLFVLLVLCETGASILARVLAPSFSPEKQDMTRKMLQIMLPAILFIGMLSLYSSVLNLKGDFKTAGLSHVIFNLSITMFAIVSMKLNNLSLLIYSYLISAALQWAVQFFAVRRTGMPCVLDFRFKDTDIRRILLLMLPIMLSCIATQFSPMAARALASGYEDGAVAALNYAYKLVMLPIGVVVGAVITAVFPRIAGAVQGDRGKLCSLSVGAYNLLLFILIPCTALMMFCSVPIINIAFERGAFTAVDTQRTAKMLMCYAPSILATGVVQLVNNEFFAFKNTKEPVLIGISCLAVGIGLSVFLASALGAFMIPAGFSIGLLLNAAFLCSRINHLQLGMVVMKKKNTIFFLVSFLIVSLLGIGVSWLFQHFIINQITLVRLGYLAICSLAIIGAYTLVAYKINALDIQEVIGLLKRSNRAET